MRDATIAVRRSSPADGFQVPRFGRSMKLGARPPQGTGGNMLIGTLFALAAGLMWGLVFVAPLPTMIIGTLPVVIAITSNLRDHVRDGRLPWARLAPSLGLIAAGLGCVNHDELSRLGESADLGRYAQGALLAVGAVACWTWYPIRNADWLRAHAGRSPTAWATAQGVATLPLAAVGFAGFWAWSAVTGSAFPLPLGTTPAKFVGLMLAIGLLASWLGTLCWNAASQRLPTTLTGQLIVFETLAALAYAYMLRGQMPGPLTLAGIALLVAGVAWAVRVRPEAVAAEGHAA